MPRLASLLVLFGLAIGCSIDGVGSSATPAAPDIRVDVVAAGLEHVWDIGFLPSSAALITERPARGAYCRRPGPAPGSAKSRPTSMTCTSPVRAA